jgi:hypothetical protein
MLETERRVIELILAYEKLDLKKFAHLSLQYFQLKWSFWFSRKTEFKTKKQFKWLLKLTNINTSIFKFMRRIYHSSWRIIKYFYNIIDNNICWTIIKKYWNAMERNYFCILVNRKLIPPKFFQDWLKQAISSWDDLRTNYLDEEI